MQLSGESLPSVYRTLGLIPSTVNQPQKAPALALILLPVLTLRELQEQNCVSVVLIVWKDNVSLACSLALPLTVIPLLSI